MKIVKIPLKGLHQDFSSWLIRTKKKKKEKFKGENNTHLRTGIRIHHLLIGQTAVYIYIISIFQYTRKF